MAWLLTIGGGVILASILLALRRSPRARLLAATPIPIREAVEGEVVKVRGTVSTEQPLRAPFTGRPCVYWRLEYTVSKPGYTRSGAAMAEEARDFSIDDDSGVARVLAERADFQVVCDIVEVERTSRLSQRGRDLAKKLRWPLEEFANIEIREGIVALGEPIDIVGVGAREPGSAPQRSERGYRDLPEMLLVFSATPLVLGPDRLPCWLGSDSST